MMDRRSRSFKDIVATLRVYSENITEETPPERMDVDGAPNGQDIAPTQKEILGHLIDFLDAC